MIDKKALTKKILYQGQWWELIKVISPNEFDDYLLLSFEASDELHSDKKTIPIDMTLINAHEDMFLTDTAENRKIYEEIDSIYEKLNDLEDSASSEWMKMLPDDDFSDDDDEEEDFSAPEEDSPEEDEK